MASPILIGAMTAKALLKLLYPSLSYNSHSDSAAATTTDLQ